MRRTPPHLYSACPFVLSVACAAAAEGGWEGEEEEEERAILDMERDLATGLLLSDIVSCKFQGKKGFVVFGFVSGSSDTICLKVQIHMHIAPFPVQQFKVATLAPVVGR